MVQTRTPKLSREVSMNSRNAGNCVLTIYLAHRMGFVESMERYIHEEMNDGTKNLSSLWVT